MSALAAVLVGEDLQLLTVKQESLQRLGVRGKRVYRKLPGTKTPMR